MHPDLEQFVGPGAMAYLHDTRSSPSNHSEPRSLFGIVGHAVSMGAPVALGIQIVSHRDLNGSIPVQVNPGTLGNAIHEQVIQQQARLIKSGQYLGYLMGDIAIPDSSADHSDQDCNAYCFVAVEDSIQSGVRDVEMISLTNEMDVPGIAFH